MKFFYPWLFTIPFLFLSLSSFSQRIPGQKPELLFDRYNSSPGPKGPVIFGDTLGVINFQGYTSSGKFHPSVRIGAYVSGDAQNQFFPANLFFMTGTPYPQTRMTILADGNVGIGTPNPIFNLHTEGNTHTTGNFYGRIHFDDNGSADAPPSSYLEEAYFEFHNRSGFGTNLPKSEGILEGGGLLTLAPKDGSNTHQLFFEDGGVFHRKEANNLNSWTNPWYKFLTSEDISGTPNKIAKFTAPSKLGDSNLWDDGKQVGIGTDNPALGFFLDVNGSTFLRELLTVNDKIGIGTGTSTPLEELTIRSIEEPGIRFEGRIANMNLRLERNDFYFRNDDGSLMVIKSDGSVAIGTTDTPPKFGDYKLFVGGGILTEEIRVRTDWADHVFEKDYELMPLSEVEKHIKENGHLPKMVSAREVEEEGLELKASAYEQQVKIEEMFLYLIEMKKELEKVKAENERLRAKIEGEE